MGQIVSVFQSHGVALTGVIGILGGIGLFLFFWRRTGSAHAFLERIWRLAAGRGKANDARLKALLEETSDLERFRFFFPMKIQRIAQVERLMVWLRENEIGIFEMKRAACWIDLNVQEILCVPPRAYSTWRAAVGLLLLVPLSIGVIVGSYPRGLFQMKATGTWFLLDQQLVNRVGEPASLDLKLCIQDEGALMEKGGFTDPEAKAICNSFRDGSLAPFVKDAVRAQRLTGLTVVVLALAGTLFLAFQADGANAARALQRRIQSRAAPRDEGE